VPNENPVPVITPFCPYHEFFRNFALRLDTSIVEPGRAGGVLLPSAPSSPVQPGGRVTRGIAHIPVMSTPTLTALPDAVAP